MRRILLLLPLVALIASCSSNDGSNPVAPPPVDTRGVALGPDHVFAHNSPLVWSPVTNEIVGFSSPTPAAGTGLIAIRATDGATRVVDPASPQSLTLSPDGTALYYVVDLPPASGDAVVLRHRLVSGGAADSLGGAPDGTPISFVLSADGLWLAWGRAGLNPLDPGPLVLRSLATGDTIDVGLGVPVVLSPDGSLLIYRPDPASTALRLWKRSDHTETPYVPNLAAGGGPPALRWSTYLQALYIEAGLRVHLANLDLGTDVIVYTSSLDLDVEPPVWSPDGSHAAVWARDPSGSDTVHLLEAIYLAPKVDTRVASGIDDHGAATFSADNTHTAHLYGERLFTAEAASTIGPPAARPAARAR